MTAFSVVSDAVVRFGDADLLGFRRYVDPLVSVLASPHTRTPFTVGIFGAWGSGKSSLISLLDQKLEDEHRDRFVRVQFNPWIHRGEQNMLIPVLHALHDTLSEHPRQQFIDSAEKIWNVLLNLGADILLKKLTADAASLKRLEELEQSYLKQRGRVESQMRTLRKTLQEQVNEINKKGAEIVFFIDDLDRCQPDQIIDVLESVKLFLDLEHVFVILAVDKEVIDRGIEVKYTQFNFAKDRTAVIGAKYLEKMIQLPLQLFPLDQPTVHGFISKLHSVLDAEMSKFLSCVAAPNPRKIKRILNILALANVIREGTPALVDLDPGLIARLVVLQVQSSDLYADVTKQPELLLALEAVFAQEIRVDQEQDFVSVFGELLGTRTKAIQELCQKYYSPGSYLAFLFRESSFRQVGDKLSLYLTMLGG